MKLALIIERFLYHSGGAERSTIEVAQELVRRGHAVTVLAGCAAPFVPARGGPDLAASDQAPPLEGVAVAAWTHRRFRSAYALWSFSRWAAAQVRRGGFDATISFTTVAAGSVVEPWGGTVRETLGRNVALRSGRGAQLWKRLRIGLTLKQQTLLALERKTMRDPQVAAFVALSAYVARQFQDHYALSADRIHIIPNAVQAPRVTAEQRALYRRRIREAFSIPPDSVAYLFAAMNPKLKGSVALLHAARTLVDQGRDCTILLAGNIGYGEQHLAATLGIRGKVRFIGPTERMTELYCAADVTVLPTFYDPSSRVVIESLLLGTPAITTAYNGAADFLKRSDGRLCGRVIPDPADHLALAAAMADLADPAERLRCAQATQGLAPQLSIAHHVDQLEAILKTPGPGPGWNRGSALRAQ
jgi:UDP-glucose:(heptosyl)LPS alpha-1,3-glucosyltransferase